MITLNEIRDAANLPGEKIATIIDSAAREHAESAAPLRRLLSRSRLFIIPTGEAYDMMLVRAALLALVLAGVYLLDPYARTSQTESIHVACGDLGIDYPDVLKLTEDEAELWAVFNGTP